MRKFALLVGMSVGFASPALAADTHVAWQGFFTVTGTTAACAGIGGTSVGDTNVAVYRAGQTATDISSMSIIFTRSAINFQNADEANNRQLRGNGTAYVKAMNKRGKPYAYQTTFSNITTSPATVYASSGYVVMTGTLNNMWTEPGCNVTFTATFGKEP
ncbi:MAG: hypothetical protein KDJ44_18965 [Rhodoblastus sp.]|nr:hypothetical protein [Rhodoblastus sp.]